MGVAGVEGFGAEHVGDAAGAGGALPCRSLHYGCASSREGSVVGWGGIFFYGDAVLEADGAAGDGGDAVSGDEDAGEVERVGGGDGDRGFVGTGGVLGAGLAKAVDSFGEGVLFAEGAGDETAAADLAAGFETTEDGEKVAPPGGVGFAGEELAEEDAVAAEEDAGVGVEGGVGLFGEGDGGLRGSLRGGLSGRQIQGSLHCGCASGRDDGVLGGCGGERL